MTVAGAEGSAGGLAGLMQVSFTALLPVIHYYGCWGWGQCRRPCRAVAGLLLLPCYKYSTMTVLLLLVLLLLLLLLLLFLWPSLLQLQLLLPVVFPATTATPVFPCRVSHF